MSPVWLKSLPWSTILSNAPLIVEGAKKLASLVKSKPAEGPLCGGVDTLDGDPPLELSALRARILRLEAELQQSAELVRTLAEGQAEMVQVLAALRVRARVNLRLAAIALIAVGALLLWTLLRSH